ncbi:hypothetical protein TNCV_1970541 [Trichonephila clavipes]|uniref:Uncharacterized protein n=1 Tax=Trichonephila clavipes TaxID=2585209 RepID=A0A8X7BF78_TRICX|nr:hypothetical protein TNCV_1970541 [Trichonephila clavipes]
MAFGECYDCQCFKWEKYFEKLSDSQEKLPVKESPKSRCIPLHASEPQLQLGLVRLSFRRGLRREKKSRGENGRKEKKKTGEREETEKDKKKSRGERREEPALYGEKG